MKRSLFSAIPILLLAAFPLSAQDFGFGEPSGADGADGSVPSSSAALSVPLSVKVGGKVSAGGSLFLYDADDLDALMEAELGDVASALLNFSASGARVDAKVTLSLNSASFANPSTILDQAWLRLYLGRLDLSAGLIELTWGKADSQGPLDVVNPVDLSNLTVTDSLERKIARPMLHAALRLGEYSKLEALWEPSFEGSLIAVDSGNPWTPSQIASLLPLLEGASVPEMIPSTDSLKYSQAGLRFTSTAGSVDWGLQYFYGNLLLPAVKMTMDLSGYPVISYGLQGIQYNRYHQAGADLAAVLLGVNWRLEAAANITDDLEGDDPWVYNPSLAFSIGGDRDLFKGISLNLQYAGTYRLFDSEVGTSGSAAATGRIDIEADSEAYSSTLTARLSKSLLKDALTAEITALWGLQDRDYLVMPSLSYKLGDALCVLSAGFFGGEEDGELGQYGENDYLKVSLGYTF